MPNDEVPNEEVSADDIDEMFNKIFVDAMNKLDQMSDEELEELFESEED